MGARWLLREGCGATAQKAGGRVRVAGGARGTGRGRREGSSWPDRLPAAACWGSQAHWRPQVSFVRETRRGFLVRPLPPVAATSPAGVAPQPGHRAPGLSAPHPAQSLCGPLGEGPAAARAVIAAGHPQAWQNLRVTEQHLTLLNEIPPSFRVLTLQHSPDRCAFPPRSGAAPHPASTSGRGRERAPGLPGWRACWGGPKAPPGWPRRPAEMGGAARPPSRPGWLLQSAAWRPCGG